jgi:hypothetical protein
LGFPLSIATTLNGSASYQPVRLIIKTTTNHTFIKDGIFSGLAAAWSLQHLHQSLFVRKSDIDE